MAQKKTDSFILQAEVRTALGKKVKNLRKQGLMPGNIYGEGMESKAISISQKEFHKMYRLAGETQLVYVHVGGTDIPTQIHNAQRHPITGLFIHSDFKKVNLRKKVETAVPVEFIEESEAVEKKHGELNVMKDELTVSALPADIPQSIQIDLSPLKEIGDEIKVQDLPKNPLFEIIEEADVVIVRVNEHVEQSTEPDLTSEVTPEESTDESAGEATEQSQGDSAETSEETSS